MVAESQRRGACRRAADTQEHRAASGGPQTELADVDRDIDDSVRGSPVWRTKEDLLASVPGVGPIIARTMVAELPELGTLGRKQIGALAGLAPFVRQSGKWKGQARIGGGRPAVRTVLFMGAQTAKQHNPVLKAFYKRLDCQRQIQDGCNDRCRSQTPHYPQRHPQRQKTMANRLTSNTVAEEGAKRPSRRMGPNTRRLFGRELRAASPSRPRRPSRRRSPPRRSRAAPRRPR